MEYDEIKGLLEEFRTDRFKILKLEKYSADDVFEVVFNERMYDLIVPLCQPITLEVSGEVITKIFFDPFPNVLTEIRILHSSEEEAYSSALTFYETEKMFSENPDDLDFQPFLDKERKLIYPEKEALIAQLFEVDIAKLKAIKIKNSHARQVTGNGLGINGINDVILYAEPACLAACIAFYNKNIVTTYNDTGGVIEDAMPSGECVIRINYEKLSDENLRVVNQLISEGIAFLTDENPYEVIITVPCNGEETVGEVSERLEKISSRFFLQDKSYATSYLEKHSISW